MYGLINKSLEELAIEKFGKKTWEDTLRESGVNIDYFLSAELYDDDITFSIVDALEKITGKKKSALFVAFGEWWILETINEKYTALLLSGGKDLKDFLVALPDFHKRIMMMYPKIKPPIFLISEVTENSLLLHYHSQRKGLRDFTLGLLQGLGIFYQEKIEVDLLQSRDSGSDHEIFKITFL